MKLYNSLTKQVDAVRPLDGQTLRIYSCGPTVYDHIHVGNLSSFIFADTLRRSLGAQVRHVMNFTDVDDKTIRRSQEEYSELQPMEALLKLTGEYSNIFMKDMRLVGNDTDNISFVRATDSIEQIQQLIQRLYVQGFAYVSDDGVYFSIEKYRSSGKQYGQLTEISAESTSQARIQNDEYDKESVHDFALWKRQKSKEPAWNFTLDGQDLTGRPGWHIECSAMSSSSLGQPFDIHTGGVDLIFPHHENEIAQSTAGQDKLYAKVFAHNEHILIDGKKMSKSLNNFYTLEDISEKGFEPLAFRLLVLQAHYRSQAHFSWDNLEAAQNRLKDFRATAALQWQHKQSGATTDYVQQAHTLEKIIQNDLRTPEALAHLNSVFDTANNELVENVDSFKQFLRSVDDLLGLELCAVPNITEGQKQLLEAREEARSQNDYQMADELRDQLAADGVGLRDTPHGAIWFWL